MKLVFSVDGPKDIIALIVSIMLADSFTLIYMDGHYQSNEFWLTMAASTIFAIMAVEDFKYQTIDIRWLGVFTVLVGLSTFKPPCVFLGLTAIGLLGFRIMFLLSTRHYEPNKLDSECGQKPYPRPPYGYLPSLGIATFTVALFLDLTNGTVPLFLLPTQEGLKFIESFLVTETEIFAQVFIALMFVWFTLEQHYRRALRKGKEILYGFGDGDVYVLAVFLGMFGLSMFAGIFFVSMFVQLGFYAYWVYQWMQSKKGC